MIKKDKASVIYKTVLYLAGLFLFLEWIYPMEQISDTSNITVFLIYTLFCFFVSMFQLKWWIGFLLKGCSMVFILNGLFFTETFLSRYWFTELLWEISHNLESLFSQQWFYLTPMFRSFLFLILIWLMSYLLHYWFVQMKRVFLFVLLTFFYIAVLDTFTVYDATLPIMRIFVISFIALGIANLMKEMDKESIRFSWFKGSPKWLIPLVSVVAISTMLGLAAPKAEPIWPDPVPFLKSAAENAGGNGRVVQKVGYGEDDSRLGGSFIQDETPVFRALVTESHYWRIETKDVYTGKGWEVSREDEFQEQTGGASWADIRLSTFENGVETEELEAGIQFEQNELINKLVYPYGVKQVNTDAQASFHLDLFKESIEARVDGEVENLAQYTMVYDNPSFEINQLRESSESDPSGIQERFTQLPDGLPERVGQLAEEITEQSETRYEKVKSVERYFRTNGFTYQTTDVAVPGNDEDYVDQFLFETMVGYCDNFSTSMVVLLRSLDIPARWAKGFTSGEVIETHGNSISEYEVRNSNAHSWVEVYFPESGWVPFEPTQGFFNPTDFHVELDENNRETAETDYPEMPEQEPEMPEQEPTMPEQEESEPAAASVSDSDTGGFSPSWWHYGILLAVITAISIIAYMTRYRWRARAMEMKLRNNRDDAETFQDAYHYLIQLLGHYGLAKNPDQTLREYAERIDARYSTDEMGELTSHYERLLYNNEVKGQRSPELTQLWKNLIKRIMG